MQGLEDPQLIFQAVPEGLSGRRFPPPSTGMRVHYLPRRARFNVTSSFASGTSASGDSGNSGSGRMLPLRLSHLLNYPSHTNVVRHRGSSSRSSLASHSWVLTPCSAAFSRS